MGKTQREWQIHKQERVETIQKVKVENKVEQWMGYRLWKQRWIL